MSHDQIAVAFYLLTTVPLCVLLGVRWAARRRKP